MSGFIPRHKDFQLAHRCAETINFEWAQRGVRANARLNSKAEILSDLTPAMIRVPPPVMKAINMLGPEGKSE